MSAVQRAWSQASDEDVLRVAFPVGSGYSNEALASAYAEFFRRGLAVPKEVQVVDPGKRRDWARDWLSICWSLVIFSALVCVWAFALVSLGVVPTPIQGVGIMLAVAAGTWPPLVATLFFFRGRLIRYPSYERVTRCGVCGHILRGLTEPRCPECGERL